MGLFHLPDRSTGNWRWCFTFESRTFARIEGSEPRGGGFRFGPGCFENVLHGHFRIPPVRAGSQDCAPGDDRDRSRHATRKRKDGSKSGCNR